MKRTKYIPQGRLSALLQTAPTRRTGPASAFTLVELLVVIALTGLLLALLLGPMVQAFRLTNRARALAEAQDATRFGMERLKRELAQAAYVFDNTNTPIVLPLDLPAGQEIRDPAIYPVQNGAANPRPLVNNAKVDFIPVATLGEGDNIAIDPTTDKPLGGRPVAMPGAPGRRIVRYFVGLRNNLPAANGEPAYYQNVYEFPRTDRDLNPFILYRAEFNPNDPNLIDPNQTNPFGAGGLHDPNFFYNYAEASNGQSYARNWRDIASPILSTTNLDVIAWRRGSDRQVEAGNPFQLQVGFSPSTVVADTATPGFIATTQAEAPGAVPTLYSAKFGQWVYPFTVTVYRGATEFSGNPGNVGAGEAFGTAQFVFRLADNGNGGLSPVVEVTDQQGRLVVGNTFYWLMDSVSGKYHIFTDNLAFSVDPARGRVETAFPPLATSNGIPLFTPAGSNTPQTMTAAPAGNFGQLVPTVLLMATRDTNPNDEQFYGEPPRRAGLQYDGNKYVPINQGIVRTELFDRPNQTLRYFSPTGLLNTPVASPFNVFGRAGSATPFRGIMLVPGSDKVLGPDNGLNNTVTYYRVPAATSSIAKKASIVGSGDSDPNRYYVWNAQMNYRVEADLDNYATPYLQFDQPASDPNATRDAAAGVPATRIGENSQALLQVDYLWQNNYARNASGQPINAQGQSVTNSLNSGQNNRVRPEADVIKLDYATRSLINVRVGARVYDVSTRTPQSAQVNDTITVNNVGR